MGLNKATLAAAIQAALDTAATPPSGPATRVTLANNLADAIDDYVKPAVVTVAAADAGLQVAPPGGGPTTAPGTPKTITGGLS